MILQAAFQMTLPLENIDMINLYFQFFVEYMERMLSIMVAAVFYMIRKHEDNHFHNYEILKSGIIICIYMYEII